MAEADQLSMEQRARAVACPILDFDIEDGEEFRQDVFRMFDLARETAPIIYSSAARGFWVFSGFELLEETLKNTELFSNTGIEVHRREDHIFPAMIPETLDPPEHHKYRTALAPMFAPRAVATYEERFRGICNSYIDKVVGKEKVDFMEVLGRPVPADFFLTMIDIPEEQRLPLTKALMAANFTTPSDDPDGSIRGANAQVVCDAIRALIADHHKHPRDDMFGQIMKRQVDGRNLTDDELFSIGLLIANAGVETTGGSLGYIFEYLATHDEAREELVADPSLILPAVEEFLRIFPVANSTRKVMHDADFHGVPLRKGDRVVINRIGANRDPSLVENGDRIILDRRDNGHATFGDGIHHCLGAHVARREIRIALEEWHKRIPKYRLDPDFKPYHHVGTTISLISLPLILG